MTRIIVSLLIAFAPPLAAVAASSTFDVGPDGWFVQDLSQATLDRVGTFSVDWSPTGGNPGGHISEADPSGFGFYFGAPSKFLGDQSAALGLTLSFDHAVNQTATENINLVVLRTTGQFLAYSSPDLPTAAFQSFVVSLQPGSEWTWYEDGLINPRAATTADFLTVLSNLTDLNIRGDYINGTEIAKLDNVQLVPEPATILLVALGLILHTAIRRIRSR